MQPEDEPKVSESTTEEPRAEQRPPARKSSFVWRSDEGKLRVPVASETRTESGAD